MVPPVRIAVVLVLLALLATGCGDQDGPDPGSQAERTGEASMSSRPLAQLFAEGATPLIRTDFSDQAAWDYVVEAVTAPVDFGDEGVSEDGDSYAAYVEPVADPTFDGATAQSLTDDAHGEPLGYALIADDRTMREAVAGGELTVVYVDLSVLPEDTEEFGWVYGRAIRCVVGEVASIEANLSIANMDFEEFADSADTDGVYRGFAE